jgi:hypothetical protein
MKRRALWAAAALACLAGVVSVVWAQQAHPNPELKKAKAFFETAGVPGKRWVEGETMVPHVAPAKHFRATMLYYPGSEEL